MCADISEFTYHVVQHYQPVILARKSRKWWNANMYHRPIRCFTLKCDMMLYHDFYVNKQVQ